MTVNVKGLEAILSAHAIFLQGLALTHPDRAHLKFVFQQLMSRHISRTEDPVTGGVLSAFEETLREALDGPGFPKPPAKS